MTMLGYLDDLRYKLGLTRYRSKIAERAERLRQKDVISVCFVITDLSFWKSEPLYRAMLENHRFCPRLGVTLRSEYTPSENLAAYRRLTDYLDQRGYVYDELSRGYFDRKPADIIFYDKPYDGEIEPSLWYRANRDRSMFCYIHYAFNSGADEQSYCQRMQQHCWMLFFENVMALASSRRCKEIARESEHVTGLPFSDALIAECHTKDLWKPQHTAKKRIIYAPHHSISDRSLLCFSTFMQNHEKMLLLAQRYSSQVQFAFKPHPVLYGNLLKIWGKKETDRYYERWAELDNGQVELGDYISLFRQSDAMIHDCCSFQIDYLYTHKPVMYLIAEDAIDAHLRPLNEFGRKAFLQHYRGYTFDQIAAFIEMVIDGRDDKKAEREEFFNDNLMPPGGKSASQNIIDAILGQ